MSDLVTLEPLRLVNGPDDDPAARLLRSARSDKPSVGSKDRVRAMLGLAEMPPKESAPPAALKKMPTRITVQRTKRARTIEPFVPFQNLIVAPRPTLSRKWGAVLVASLQVAAILAAIFIRPTPRPTAVARRDEPEMVFFAASKPSRGVQKTKSSLSKAVDFQAGMIPPLRIAGSDPFYPKSAQLYGVAGTVSVQCVVTENGFTEHCEVLKSPAYLDRAVLDAARTWRFKPVVWQGHPVAVRYVFKYNFKLG